MAPRAGPDGKSRAVDAARTVIGNTRATVRENRWWTDPRSSRTRRHHASVEREGAIGRADLKPWNTRGTLELRPAPSNRSRRKRALQGKQASAAVDGSGFIGPLASRGLALEPPVHPAPSSTLRPANTSGLTRASSSRSRTATSVMPKRVATSATLGPLSMSGGSSLRPLCRCVCRSRAKRS